MLSWEAFGKDNWLLAGTGHVATVYSDGKYRMLFDSNVLYSRDTLELAKAAAESAFREWLKSANLQEVPEKS